MPPVITLLRASFLVVVHGHANLSECINHLRRNSVAEAIALNPALDRRGLTPAPGRIPHPQSEVLVAKNIGLCASHPPGAGVITALPHYSRAFLGESS
jgi:hypothetical protein